MLFDASSGMTSGPGFSSAVEEVGARSARLAKMLWKGLDAVQSTKTPAHDFLKALDTEDHLPARKQYAQSGLWSRIHNLTSFTCGKAMKALRKIENGKKELKTQEGASTTAGDSNESFRDFFMEAVTGACESDLEKLRKDEQMTDSTVAQLVGCLEAGIGVFGALEKQVCLEGLAKPVAK